MKKVLDKMVSKKLLIEIKLVEESKQKPDTEIINDVYYDIFYGNCIIPWCDSVLKVVKIPETTDR